MNKGEVLSELDFLKLADERRVARVDLSRIGRAGVVFVVEMSTATQSAVFFAGMRKRTLRKDGGQEVEFPLDSGPRLLEECLVTDDQGGVWLEEQFSEAEARDGAAPKFILVSSAKLIYMRERWIRELGNVAKMREYLKSLPNPITSHIAGAINEISGIDDEDESGVEEKKES